MWHTSVDRVVRRTTSYGQESIAAEDAFREHTREWVSCQAFFTELALYAMDGIAQESATSLDVSSMLLFAREGVA